MLSPTSWCNMDTSFHEYGSVGHKLIHKWHHHSLPPYQQSDYLPPLHQHSLDIISFFYCRRHKTPNLSHFNNCP